MMVLNRMAFKKRSFEHKLLRKVMRSDLYSIYLATVFTRNPNLIIPSQKIAILMVSFVQSVQQIFLRKWSALSLLDDDDDTAIRSEINNALNIMYSIRSWVGNIGAKEDNYWFGLTEKLQRELPGRFMTQSQDENVSSVCKVLCAICCFDEMQPLFAEHQSIRDEPKSEGQRQKLMQCRLSKLAIAMMGESTSRECRILVRNDEDEMWKLIGKGLGIRRETDGGDFARWYNDGDIQKVITFRDTFVVDKASRASAKFFSTKLKTNCTPHGIVGCLGFARCIHQFMAKEKIESIWELLTCGDVAVQQQLMEYILGKFRSRKITMKRFIRHYLPKIDDPVHVQIALYLQGLRYHTARARRDGLPELVDPLPIIRNIATGYRQHTFEEYCKKRNADLKRKLLKQQAFSRYRRTLMEHTAFMAAGHGLPNTPRMFTVEEWKGLNARRSAHDKFELMPSGLLRHCCCYPECELFMVNLSTEKDRILGERRGLFKHLEYFQKPDSAMAFWTPGFHLNCMRMKGKERQHCAHMSESVLLEKMIAKYPRQNAVNPALFAVKVHSAYEQLCDYNQRRWTGSTNLIF